MGARINGGRMSIALSRAAILSFGFILIVMSIFTSATTPVAPDTIERGPSERAPLTGGSNAQVSEGGNLTPLFVSGQRITARWQGYFGNVSGGITLADASGNSLYDWGLVNPSGEIYAANHSTVSWSAIFCANFSANLAEENLNRDTLNAFIGYGSDLEKASDDSVNSTFNQTFTGTLIVGARTFTGADNCSMVTLNTASGYQTADFQEVILTDNTSVVFTSILEQNVNGFNSIPADFEMIVGVNSTVQGTTRTFYFFVELS
jgi:hypothetical protein